MWRRRDEAVQMARPNWMAAAAVCGFAALASPPVSPAAVTPSPPDPCANAGRDTCGTQGIGFYRRYRYGIRWFGDYRRAIPGEAHAFCLDLGLWYASRSYRYRPQAIGPLRNRAGETVPLERQEELAYAIWRYGRSVRASRQAAVMLYVHSRMGDARPGELDPAALSPAVASLYRRIVRDTRTYHGPYRIEARLPAELTVGNPATATIRIVSARGHPLPYLRVTLSARGASGLPPSLETNRAGLARLPLTPTTTTGLRLRLSTEPLAPARPRVFVPTAAGAVANGQRLAVPSAQPVVATISRADVGATPRLSTRASTELVAPGTRIADTVSVAGLGNASVPVHVELWGPFASRGAIRCRGIPYWTGSFVAHGDSTTTTAPVRLGRAGFYAYRERLVGSTLIAAATTPCALEAATTLAAPRIVTGRGDVAAYTKAVATRGGLAPVRIRIHSLGIDAPVSPAAIDVAHGVLGIPNDIGRVGWWRDGTPPGADRGPILLAGHVDSARAGKGAFFGLDHAARGAIVQLSAATGRTLSYRVASVRAFRKSALPISVFARTGAPRLVLVTCGGPFDASTGHYRDNIVVTALPTV